MAECSLCECHVDKKGPNVITILVVSTFRAGTLEHSFYRHRVPGLEWPGIGRAVAGVFPRLDCGVEEGVYGATIAITNKVVLWHNHDSDTFAGRRRFVDFI